MRKILIIIICLFFVFLWFSCNQSQESKNPIPTLTSISPTIKVSHMPTFTLTATGTDFIHGAKIIFNGIAKQTLRVNSTELTCQIEPENTLLTNALQDQTVNMAVEYPTPWNLPFVATLILLIHKIFQTLQSGLENLKLESVMKDTCQLSGVKCAAIVTMIFSGSILTNPMIMASPGTRESKFQATYWMWRIQKLLWISQIILMLCGGRKAGILMRTYSVISGDLMIMV
jgi:hypothetical protein